VRAIDLFAGAGGFTEGATQAGASVLFAANHWQEAVNIHAINHPETQHACQDLHQIDWRKVPAHDLLLASPACQGHSRARGKDKPYHDALRSTAWAVTTGLEVHRPKAFVVENVPEFTRWELFRVWLFSLECLGYKVTTQVLNAADFGVPQSRERLFVVGSLEKKIAVVSPGLPHVPARSIIDWTVGGWSPVEAEGRAANTLTRYRNGRDAHGSEFLLAYYGSENGGRSLDRPIGTLTTRDRYAVVRGDRFRMLTADEVRRGMGFPDGYRLPTAKTHAVKMLGNAVPPPLARGVVGQVMAAVG